LKEQRVSGKGSKPRPYSVSQTQFANNWDNIFKKSTLQDRMQSEAELFSIHDKCGTDECCMTCDAAENNSQKG